MLMSQRVDAIPEENEKKFLKLILLIASCCAIVLTLLTMVFVSIPFGLSALAGAVISVASLFAAQREMHSLFVVMYPLENEGDSDDPEKKQVHFSKGGFILRFWLRLLVIGIVLFFLIRSGKVNIFGLIAGLSTVVLAIFIFAAYMAGRFMTGSRR